jgi:TatD DNase family protein
MMLIDTHTHLYAEEFNPDRKNLMEKAMANGIRSFYLPNIDSGSIDAMLQLEAQFPENCFAMMGLHPCSVKEDWQKELAIIEQWLKKRKFAAIGEIGIDLYWDKSFFEEQKTAFRQQIDWALEYHYPISIHCREAFDPIYEILKTYKTLPKTIFHCFSGNLEQARSILALGDLKLGIGGVVTFKNSGLDKVIGQIGLEHLVLETDAPYLAPVPFRGKRNEPAYMLEVAKKIAEVKDMSLDEVAKITSQNAEYIFQRA